MAQKHVFLTECGSFSEAQVVKSFLESIHLNPRIRDENTRGIAPHYEQLLGKIIIEIPEDEFMKASLELERSQSHHTPESTPNPTADELLTLEYSQNLARKCLMSAILGCVLIPVLCNFYSMILGYRVMKIERPLSPLSRRRLFWALIFNSVAFYAWLALAPTYFR